MATIYGVTPGMTEQTISIRSYSYDHQAGHLRSDYAQLTVRYPSLPRGGTMPHRLTTDEEPIDGVSGFYAAADGVRYRDLVDFLTQWRATPVSVP